MRQCYHLMVQVHRIEAIGGGYTRMFNPYVIIEFNGQSVSSTTAFGTHTCSLSEAFRLPAMSPLYDDGIIVKVMHKGVPGMRDQVLCRKRAPKLKFYAPKRFWSSDAVVLVRV